MGPGPEAAVQWATVPFGRSRRVSHTPPGLEPWSSLRNPRGSRPRWGFAGNLTATWQVFVPVGAHDDVRASNWGPFLVSMDWFDTTPGRHGANGARRIGDRLKRYAVLHPYATQLKVAAIGAGDFPSCRTP